MATDVTIGGDGSLFVGENKTFVLELLDSVGNPVDMTGWAMHFVVRLKDTSPDPPIFNKTVVVGGTFNSVRAVNTQRGYAQLTHAELDTVKQKKYRHSWARTDAGAETIVSRGDFTPEKATQL